MRVSQDGAFLLHDDGSTFFYLADTAWELLHRLTREETDFYLATRARQRFTVIQAVILAEQDGLRTPNAYGQVPLHDLDPARPNDGYFKHVDYVVARAAELGLTMGLLPTWGDKVSGGGAGPVVFNHDNARTYGEFLGRRYRDWPIIWILGGDRRIGSAKNLLTWRAMAHGIRAAGGRPLMTFHPDNGSSSAQVHGEDWLDFHMLQSSHVGHDKPNWAWIELDRARVPARPVLDGEPNYEDHPVVDAQWKPTGEWFDDYDVRKQAYRPLLAGACGHTYGCHGVWQMWDGVRPPSNLPRTPWREALELPGARQMQHVRALFEARDWRKLVADQSLAVGDKGKGPDHIRAARAADGSYAYVYLPKGGQVTMDVNRLAGSTQAGTPTARWYDPRTGQYSQAQPLPSGQPALQAPDDRDWVLVVERR